jgi:[calcium/calmodulin-dependent protein kinase] kinase
VRLVIDSKKKETFAMKILNKKKLRKKLLNKKTSAYTMIEKEMAVMKKLAHPNICKLYEIIDDPQDDKLYLIMEYVKQGALASSHFWKIKK